MTPDSDVSADQGAAGRQVAAMVLRTFGPPAGDPASPRTDSRGSVVETAVGWQQIGPNADFFELHGASLGVERDRLYELAGCVAAAGEQLGLAWTSEQDSERWQQGEPDRMRMAVRALADVRAHFTLGAAHGMGNATLRTLFLSPGVATNIRHAEKRFKQYPAFSDDRDAWPAFNNTLVTALEAGARAAGDTRVTGFVGILRTLVDDARYKALEERRGMDFHRWRPQSLPTGSGVPRGSPWKVSAGARSVGVGGRHPADPLAEPGPVALIATEGMDAVAEAMRAWIGAWPHALEALGVEILGT